MNKTFMEEDDFHSLGICAKVFMDKILYPYFALNFSTQKYVKPIQENTIFVSTWHVWDGSKKKHTIYSTV